MSPITFALSTFGKVCGVRTSFIFTAPCFTRSTIRSASSLVTAPAGIFGASVAYLLWPVCGKRKSAPADQNFCVGPGGHPRPVPQRGGFFPADPARPHHLPQFHFAADLFQFPRDILTLFRGLRRSSKTWPDVVRKMPALPIRVVAAQ